MENWKVIPGYEKYEASDMGHIRNATTGYILSQAINGSSAGYYFVRLSLTPKHRPVVRVAKLVALAFLPPRPLGYQIEHIDQNRFNNKITNLKYVTPSENVTNSYKAGSHPKKQPNMQWLKPHHYKAIVKLKCRGIPQAEIGRRIGCHESSISCILSGKVAAALPYLKAI
jgi:hypothetical protein